MTVYVVMRDEGERRQVMGIHGTRASAERLVAHMIAEGDLGFYIAGFDVGFEANGLLYARRKSDGCDRA